MKSIPKIALLHLAIIVGILAAIAVSGCSSWTFTKETISADTDQLRKIIDLHTAAVSRLPDGDRVVLYERIVARQEQVLTTREMKDVEILIDDAALLTVGSSSMNSHEITLLVEQLKPAILAAIEAWMGGGGI